MFVQIGYYVENEYAEPFEPENYPNPVNIALLNRNIVANEPRVTRYAIDWTGQNPVNNQLLLEHELADGQTNQDYEDTKEGEAEEEGDEDDEEDEEGDEEDDDDDEGDAEIDLDEKEEEDEADMMNDDEGEADAQDVIVNQFILNEDSMDVHAMQIEHSSHSHSHSGSYRDLI
jgi:histone chaperone ASF1